jgi:hypothetical protein
VTTDLRAFGMTHHEAREIIAHHDPERAALIRAVDPMVIDEAE